MREIGICVHRKSLRSLSSAHEKWGKNKSVTFIILVSVGVLGELLGCSVQFLYVVAAGCSGVDTLACCSVVRGFCAVARVFYVVVSVFCAVREF